MILTRHILPAFLSLWLVLPAAAFSALPDMPEYTVAAGDETHPPIRIAPGKSRTVHLEQNASKVNINDAEILQSFISRPGEIVLMARAAGTTRFTALDKSDKTIMSRAVIISAGKERYIKLRPACAGSPDKNCGKVKTYYCSDQCYETHIAGGK